MQALSIDGYIALGTAVTCLAGLARFRHAPDAIMLAGVTLLLLTGVIGVDQALAGFANPGVLTIAALFIVVAGLRESGVVSALAVFVLGHPRGERVAMARMFLPVAGASAVINNTPVVALFVPAIVDWAERHRLAARRLLLPLSYIAIAAGTCSLLGSATNIIANSLLIEATGDGIGLFETAWLGLPLLAVTAVYLLAYAPRVLPGAAPETADAQTDAHAYFIKFTVDAGGPLVGRSITQADLRNLRGVYLARIERDGHTLEAVAPDEVLQAGDRLGFVGNADDITDVLTRRGLSSARARFEADDLHNLSELVVGPRASLVGKTIRESGFRGRHKAVILAVRRHGELLSHRKLGDIRLEGGDTLLVSSPDGFVQRRGNSEFPLIRHLGRTQRVDLRRSVYALGVFAGMVALAATGVLPLLTASWLAAGLMLAGRCLDVASARGALDLSVLTVIAGSIAVGTALESTGVAQALASVMTPIIPATPHATIFGIFLLTMVLSSLVTNSAAVVIVFPIALDIAAGSGLAGPGILMAVIAGASASFATPIAYQTNLMVQGPGRYRFGDFLRLGLPLCALFAAVSTLLIPVLY